MTALRPIALAFALCLLAACASTENQETKPAPPAKTDECDKDGGIGGTGKHPNRPDCLKIGIDAKKS